MIALTPDETILGLLATQPQHGYDLLEHFREPTRLGEVWHLSTSQLYAVLKRLEQKGWITGVSKFSPNAPVRVEYSLTNSGREALEQWLAEEQLSASIRRVRVEFLSRLYVSCLLQRPLAPLVQRQRDACQRQLEQLLSQRQELDKTVGGLALDLWIAQLHAALEWLVSDAVTSFNV